MKTTNYPKEILTIAEQQIKLTDKKIKTIVPIYNRGFVAVIEDKSNPITDVYFQPFFQVGTYGKDFIKLEKSHRCFYNYDEAIIALITFKNLGVSNTAATYIDIYCNKMGVTAHSNSINPLFDL